jgi:hypothetical protein
VNISRPLVKEKNLGRSSVHDVFISYIPRDKGIADAICQKLESAGVKCWIAQRNVSPNEDWPNAIRKAIGLSRVVILLLSGNASAAIHLEREIAHAFYTGRTILPVRLTSAPPPSNFLFYLGEVSWFDAFDESLEQHLEGLVARVKDLLPNSNVPCRTVIPQSRIATTSNALPARRDALRASDEGWRVQGMRIQVPRAQFSRFLKRLVICAAACVGLWLLWAAPKQSRSPAARTSQASSDLDSNALLDSVPPQIRGKASKPGMSKPGHTMGPLGIWIPSSPESSSSTEQEQPVESLSLPPGGPGSSANSTDSEAGQTAATETNGSGTDDDSNVKPPRKDSGHGSNRRQEHRTKPQAKPGARKLEKSNGSRFARYQKRLRDFWRKNVARDKRKEEKQ